MQAKLSLRLPKSHLPWLSWALLIAVIAFAHVTFMYDDLTNTIDNSNILIDVIREGRLPEFYEISVERAATSWAANYSLPIYLIFAIWQFPMRLVCSLLGKTYLTWRPALLWSKTLVLLFSLGVALMVSKIVKLVTDPRDDQGDIRPQLAAFLYLSSIATFYSVGLCGQLESISLFLMLCGLYHYLRNNNRQFWLFFALAAPFKLFAFLLAAPLVLARQKSIFKAGIWLLSLSVLLVAEKVLFAGSPTYSFALAAQNRDVIAQLLSITLPLGMPVAVFVACYFALLVYSYNKNNPTHYGILYMGLFLWGTFLAYAGVASYWICLFAPFFAMCAVTATHGHAQILLTETLVSLSHFLVMCITGAAPFWDESLASRLLLCRFVAIPEVSQRRFTNMSDLMSHLGLTQFQTIFSTLFVVSMTVLLILCFPRLQENARLDCHQHKHKYKIPLPVTRLIVNGSCIVLVLVPMLWSSNPIAIDTTTQGEPYVAQVDLTSTSEEAIVEQPLTFQDSRDLTSLTLRFQNDKCDRSNLGLLIIEILNAESNELAYKDALGCSFIPSNEDIHIDLHGTHVDAGIPYVISLYSRPGVVYYQDVDRLSPYVVSIDDEVMPATVDGQALDGCLYLSVR